MKIKKTSALDLFNLIMGGEIACALQSARTDYKHMPCVLEVFDEKTSQKCEKRPTHNTDNGNSDTREI